MTDVGGGPPSWSWPRIVLSGEVDVAMARTLADGLAAAEGDGPLLVELTTAGGDPDLARAMVGALRGFRDATGRRLVFLGRGPVYSAGVGVMSGFPVEDRWLAREATLLLHGRSMLKTLNLDGPLPGVRVQVEALLAEIDSGLAMQREDFERLVAGSDLSPDELLSRAATAWYLPADEAAALRLVAGFV